MARTNAEWQELMQRLQALIDNPRESKERRAKAQRILDGIVRPTVSKPQLEFKDTKGTRGSGVSREASNYYDGKIR